MKYMGSKRRISRYILPFILQGRRIGQYYVEPFVGGGNMIENVRGPRIGADINPYLIEALKLIRDDPHSLPDSITEEEYRALKTARVINGLTGYAGFTMSFGAQFLKNYARNKKNSDYAAEAKRSALKQSPKLRGVELVCSKYSDLDIPDRSIIYCDPPYASAAGYKTGKFNHEEFYQWCRWKHAECHQIFISEYNMPSDFKCVWMRAQTTNINNAGRHRKTDVEKLYAL